MTAAYEMDGWMVVGEKRVMRKMMERWKRKRQGQSKRPPLLMSTPSVVTIGGENTGGCGGQTRHMCTG